MVVALALQADCSVASFAGEHGRSVSSGLRLLIKVPPCAVVTRTVEDIVSKSHSLVPNLPPLEQFLYSITILFVSQLG